MNSQNKLMEGKVCLVTGATSGIGKQTALALAGLGATTVLVGRDAAKGEACVREILSASSNAHVSFLRADLSSLTEVRALAARATRQYPRLHVLVNNAGTLRARRQETVDGLEATFALNHLSPFLLTNLLLDALKAGAPSRIVNVSSALHAQAALDLEDLQSRRHYPSTGMAPYNRSKLANLLFTYELARRLSGTEVTVNAAGLGLTRSPLYRRENIGTFASLVMRLMTMLAPTAEKAAAAITYLAASPDVAGMTGKYFVGCAAVPSSAASRDHVMAEKLWRISADLVGLRLAPPVP